MDMQKERELLKKHTYPDDDLLDRDDLSVCEKWFLMGYREAAKASAVLEKECVWKQDEDANWWTKCGEGFVFDEPSRPSEQNFQYCCFCGGKLIEAAQEQGHDCE